MPTTPEAPRPEVATDNVMTALEPGLNGFLEQVALLAEEDAEEEGRRRPREGLAHDRAHGEGLELDVVS